MRVLLVTNPFKSHLYVLVPLAWALRSAGHEVCVAGPPDMAEAIAGTGLSGVPVGEVLDIERRIAEAEPIELPAVPVDPAGERLGKSVQSDYGWSDPYFELKEFTWGVRTVFSPDSAFDDLIAFARRWRPDLVINDASAFPGGVAARVVGAAHARMLFGVDRVAQLRAACRSQLDGAGDPMREWLQPILGRYDCDFDEATVVGQWSIAPMPSWIWRPEGVHYLPMRHVPFNGPSMLPRWLYEPTARRRICVTLGLSHREANVGAVASARDLFDAAADLNVEVVATLSTSQLGGVSELPAHVRAFEFVPLNELLPTCSAVVHSGGAGTFASGLENGVPQVIVPNDYKTEKWWGPVAMGTGLEHRGAGVYAANADRLTADRLRDGLKQVLEDPSYATAAAQVRTEVMAMPSPSDVVPALEKLTAEFRAPRR